MRLHTQNRRWAIVAVVAVGALLALALAIGAGWLYNQFNAGNYPGSVRMAGHNLYDTRGSLYFRRDTAYRTNDNFTQVYDWYSQTFHLGPEARAASACITMERAVTWWRVERYTGVTVCDTPNGRMMYVQRSIMLRRSAP